MVDVDAAAALQRDEAEGEFATQLVTERTRQIGASSILTPADAAQAANHLAPGAQDATNRGAVSPLTVFSQLSRTCTRFAATVSRDQSDT